MFQALFDAVVWMTVRQKQIQVAIVVVIKKLHSPAAQQPCGDADTGLHGHVIETLIVAIAINRIHLLVHIGDEQVHPAVPIIIGRVHAHSRARVSIGAVSHSGQQSDVFKLSFSPVGE